MLISSSVEARPVRDLRRAPDGLLARLGRARIITWLDHAAIPFWLDHGVDLDAGGFHEVLDFSGQPVETDKRLRTMARQTFAFASAAERKWGNTGKAHAAVAHGIKFLNQQARQADGSFARTFAFDGTVRDTTRDLYDYAFLLFAAAAAVRVGSTEATALGNDVMHQLESGFHLGRGLGYREVADIADGTNTDGIRRANPHMHLLEAFTAWHRATGDTTAQARAAEIVELFFDRFFDSETWSLREFFDVDLAPLNNQRGAIREPGHAFEWAWLLHDFDQTHSARTQWVVQRLTASAKSFGTNPLTGLTYQQVSLHGTVLDDTSRSWPQTEAIRAMLALRSYGGPNLMESVDAHIDRLFEHHIAPAPTGLWYDRIGVDGALLSENVPASILYHMISAFSAVLDSAA